MKLNKNLVFVFLLLIIVSALFRLIPGRPLGFSPHIAMALFGGAVIKDKKWAFALPIFSLFLSDLLYQFLYINGLTDTAGFYRGQLANYGLFIGMTALGFLMKDRRAGTLIGFFFMAPTIYFLVSNFGVWIGRGGYVRPLTFEGLMQCYTDALPFYKGAVMATFTFGAIFFGLYWAYLKANIQKVKAWEQL